MGDWEFIVNRSVSVGRSSGGPPCWGRLASMLCRKAALYPEMLDHHKEGFRSAWNASRDWQFTEVSRRVIKTYAEDPCEKTTIV